jgi:hypothetical protein
MLVTAQTLKTRRTDMSFVKLVNKATARRQSEYFTPGSYIVRIDDFKEGTNRKGRDYVVLETTILDSSNQEENPAGAKRSWLLMQDVDSTARNVRGMLCAVLGISDSELTLDMIENALQPDEETQVSSLAGLKAFIHARNVETNRGGVYTLLNFNSVADDVSSLSDIKPS